MASTPEPKEVVRRLARGLCQHGPDRHNILAAEERICGECMRHERTLNELGLGELLAAGQVMREGLGHYAMALNMVPFDADCVTAATRECLEGLKAHDAAKAKVLS